MLLGHWIPQFEKNHNFNISTLKITKAMIQIENVKNRASFKIRSYLL